MPKERMEQVILYCQRVARAEEVAGRLGCDVYHSRVAGKDEKSGVVRRWVEAGGAIVATCALGAGIDIPDVRLVVHVGIPSSLRDFVQESGRAGRDGSISRSIIVVQKHRIVGQAGNGTGTSTGTSTSTSTGTGTGTSTGTGTTTSTGTSTGTSWVPPDKEDIKEYIQTSVRCRRIILSRVMDGITSRTECVAEEVDCDLCCIRKVIQHEEEDLRLPDAEEAASLQESRFIIGSQVQRVQKVGRQVAEFVRCLRFYERNCLPCLIFHDDGRNQSYESHPFGYGICTLIHHESDDAWGDIFREGKKVKSLIGNTKNSLRPYYGCYFCGLPQRYCVRWQEEEQDAGRFRLVQSNQSCSYEQILPEVLGTMVAAGWAGDIIQDGIRIVRELGVWVEEGTSFEDFCRIGIRWGDLQVNGFCILFWLVGMEHIREE
ncbi:hypothetical protein QBC43DRAFT_305289 [Cladorrhinum sp. PSN259]|nr:hypothetical protein QBC43DRAFT_305289 [Cladorrhinum sp. PSN259]